jgi:hypothetical protein
VFALANTPAGKLFAIGKRVVRKFVRSFAMPIASDAIITTIIVCCKQAHQKKHKKPQIDAAKSSITRLDLATTEAV